MSVHRGACPQGCILLGALTFRRPISLTQSCLALASIISNILGERKKKKNGSAPAPPASQFIHFLAKGPPPPLSGPQFCLAGACHVPGATLAT